MSLPRTMLLLVCGMTPAVAGSFVNLNFESSLPSSPVPGDPWDRHPISRVMIGWSGYNGDQPETAVSINNIFLDSAGISLFTTRVSGPLNFSSQILQGTQSAFLQAGVQLGGGPIVPTTLAQTGTVPVGMQSLQFEAITGNSPFTVSLNGVAAPVWELAQNDRGTAPPSKTFGVDLSPYAGKEVDLRFTVLPGDTQHGTLVLDGLQFSANSVPEPATWTLLGTGAIALGLRLRKQGN
ncbi:MAG: PEP-CTERM sorting domain-containing protein [Verrucomicrobiota bacterium]